MKASDLFVRCLEAEGVRHVFGVPGEENADLMMSLQDSSVEFILCRHEQSAAFIADVYGRLTGRAGVCLATLGPGATNLVTGVADANMDRSPVVVITGQAGTDRMHKESHQHMDVMAMFRPLSKWAQTVHHPDTIPEIIRKAFKTAEAEKPGAAIIELPEDIAETEAQGAPLPVRKTRRAGADHRAVADAVTAIVNARNPIVLAGNGAIRKRASAQLRRFAELTGIGVVNTFMGKGAVPAPTPTASIPSASRAATTPTVPSTNRTSSYASDTTSSNTARHIGTAAPPPPPSISTSHPLKSTAPTPSRWKSCPTSRTHYGKSTKHLKTGIPPACRCSISTPAAHCAPPSPQTLKPRPTIRRFP